jgi:hypothetical protein
MSDQMLHHLFNHIPSIGQIIGLLLLVYSIMIKSAPVTKAALLVILVSAIAVMPANATGEGAEESTEELAGVSHDQIHRHEEAAESAFVITLISGAIALVSLVASWRKWSFANAANWVLLLAGAVSIYFLVIASHEGGLIRHPEMGNTAVQSGVGGQEGEEVEDDD